jgi:hypothetical protein
VKPPLDDRRMTVRLRRVGLRANAGDIKSLTVLCYDEQTGHSARPSGIVPPRRTGLPRLIARQPGARRERKSPFKPLENRMRIVYYYTVVLGFARGITADDLLISLD